jgi:hypothetical protein
VTVYEAAPSQASLSCPTARSPDLGQQARSSYRGVISPHPCRHRWQMWQGADSLGTLGLVDHAQR